MPVKHEPESKDRRHLKLLLFVVAISCLAAPSDAGAQVQQQARVKEQRSYIVKLDVKVDSKSKDKTFYLGESPTIRVGLLDANNKPVAAAKDFEIEILVKSESGETIDHKPLVIKEGSDAATVQLGPAKQTGVLEIQAKQPELLEGGTMLFVRPKPSTHTTRVAPKSSIKRSRVRSVPAKRSLLVPFPSWPPAAGPRIVEAAFYQAADDAFELSFKKAPERALKSDGNDVASISIVFSHPAPQDMAVHISASGGRLDTSSLHVYKGDPFSTEVAHLTSDQAGTVTVRCLGSDQPVGLQCNETIDVAFEAPITSFGFSAAPPRIPLIDRSDLVVRLYDNHDNPVDADKDRQVSFEIDSSIGSLEQGTITIKSGHAEERTRFIPTSRGQVGITAFMTGFQKKQVNLEVTTPVLILSLSVIGGLMGGLIAYSTRRDTKWRIPIGAVTGFMLYWACAFSLISYMPRQTVLNQLSAVAIPLLGGWLGTEVFSMLLNKIGFIVKKPA